MVSLFSKIKKAFGRISRDELEGLTEDQKTQLKKVEQERRFELIAASRLRKLEEKLTPKPKKSASEVFAEIKKFRESNLKKRAERLSLMEGKKKKFKAIEEMRKTRSRVVSSTPKSTTKKSSVGEKIRQIEEARRERMLRRGK